MIRIKIKITIKNDNNNDNDNDNDNDNNNDNNNDKDNNKDKNNDKKSISIWLKTSKPELRFIIFEKLVDCDEFFEHHYNVEGGARQEANKLQ